METQYRCFALEQAVKLVTAMEVGNKQKATFDLANAFVLWIENKPQLAEKTT